MITVAITFPEFNRRKRGWARERLGERERSRGGGVGGGGGGGGGGERDEEKDVLIINIPFTHIQESKLSLVEGLQKLLEVNGRKDVIRRDYTT